MKTKKQLTQETTQAINTGKLDVSKLVAGAKSKAAKAIKPGKANAKTKEEIAEPKYKAPKDLPAKKEKKAEDKKKEVVKATAKNNKVKLIESVVTNREVKYIYPADVTDTLSKKAWRQKTRRELERLETAYLRIKDQESKDYKAAKKAYDSYFKQVRKAV